MPSATGPAIATGATELRTKERGMQLPERNSCADSRAMGVPRER